MKHIFTKVTAVLLAICLIAGSGAAVFAGGFEGYEPLDHPPLSASDLRYKGWDDDRFDQLLADLERMDASSPDSAFLDTYQQILKELDDCYTQYVLADAAYYADVNDQRAIDDSDEMYDMLTDAQDDFFVAMQRILRGPKGKLLKSQLTGLQVDWIETYVEETEELERLHKEENRLVQDYYSAVSEVENIEDYEEWARAENELCGPIFLDLVQVRDEIARMNGYDNYYDYGFDSYGRDYTAEDVDRLCEEVKSSFADLRETLYYAWYFMDYPEHAEDFITQEDILDAIGPCIAEIHPDLAEAFDYMRRYRTYDLEYSDAKAETGYTDNLPSYHGAFIFNSPYDSYQDYSDLVHEFGHYNAAFHDPTPSVYMASVLDVAEIHSQALELLITRYAEDLYGLDADFMTVDVLYRMVNSVLTGCMYDEFQRIVYQNPDMDLEEINELAEDLAYEYGVYGSGCEAYEWVDVSHTFDMPMYYISYGTSALSALDIWRQSLEDWDGAVDRYMQVTALDSAAGYMEAVDLCGLMDFTDRGAVRQLAEDVDAYFSEYFPDWAEEASESDPVHFSDPAENMHGLSDKLNELAENAKGTAGAFLKALLLVVAVLTLLVIAVIALLWRSHKGEEITNQTPANPGYTEDPTDISSYYAEFKPNTQSMIPEEKRDDCSEE